MPESLQHGQSETRYRLVFNNEAMSAPMVWRELLSHVRYYRSRGIVILRSEIAS